MTEITYYDDWNEEQTITAPYANWTQAREWFERKIDYTIIISHKIVKH